MLNKVLRTPVDDMVDILKVNKKCKISYLVSKLGVSSEVLERWLIILEEFGVLTLKYEGFEGYASLKSETVINKKGEIDIDKLKDDFLRKSKSKNLDYSKIEKLWLLFIKKYELEIKELFFKKARGKNYSEDKIERAWIKFREELEVL